VQVQSLNEAELARLGGRPLVYEGHDFVGADIEHIERLLKKRGMVRPPPPPAPAAAAPAPGTSNSEGWLPSLHSNIRMLCAYVYATMRSNATIRQTLFLTCHSLSPAVSPASVDTPPPLTREEERWRSAVAALTVKFEFELWQCFQGFRVSGPEHALDQPRTTPTKPYLRLKTDAQVSVQSALLTWIRCRTPSAIGEETGVGFKSSRWQ
jgi:hypothetical protein